MPILWIILAVLTALSLGMSIGYLILSYGQYKRDQLAIKRGHIMLGGRIFKLTPITLIDAFVMDQMTGYSNNLKKYMEGE